MWVLRRGNQKGVRWTRIWRRKGEIEREISSRSSVLNPQEPVVSQSSKPLKRDLLFFLPQHPVFLLTLPSLGSLLSSITPTGNLLLVVLLSPTHPPQNIISLLRSLTFVHSSTICSMSLRKLQPSPSYLYSYLLAYPKSVPSAVRKSSYLPLSYSLATTTRHSVHSCPTLPSYFLDSE